MGRPWRRLVTGAVVAGAVSLVAGGAYAYWTASAAAPGVTVTAGRLDLLLDGQLAGPGGSVTVSGVAASDLIPNESVAYTITVGNGGDVPLVYRATATASGTLAPYLRFSVYTAGAATNTGSAEAGNRAGSCTGTATAVNVTLTASATAVIGADQLLAPAGTQSVCVRVQLPGGAASSAQGQAASAALTFTARNVGAPP